VALKLYPDLIEILPRALAAAALDGEEVASWPDPTPPQRHWARIESASGSNGGAAPASSGGGLALRFRHRVTVAAFDRVRVKETGDVYGVTGLWTERAEDGGWQTVCTLAFPDF
jgi:hypothetical protein